MGAVWLETAATGEATSRKLAALYASTLVQQVKVHAAQAIAQAAALVLFPVADLVPADA